MLCRRSSIRSRLRGVAINSDTEEVVILTITPSFEDRVRSYELLAAEYSLDGVCEKCGLVVPVRTQNLRHELPRAPPDEGDEEDDREQGQGERLKA